MEAPLISFVANLRSRGTCWVWTGELNSAGYGLFWIPEWSRPHLAHRWIYSYWVEPIWEGLTIDHLCRVHECCNPDHLEAVTPAENTTRNNRWQALRRRGLVS